MDREGNVYLTGITAGVLPGQTKKGGLDAFLSKYHASGDELWTRQFGSDNPGRSFDSTTTGISVAVDGQANVYVVGETFGTFSGQLNAGLSDAFLRKYDASGAVLWTRQFGSDHRDLAPGVAADEAGNVYVAGMTYGVLPDQTNAGVIDAFLRKYDASGEALWTRQFGSDDNEGVSDVAADGVGNIYVLGQTAGALPGQTGAGAIDAFLRKYDPSGEVLWTRQFGSDEPDTMMSVTVDREGSVYVGGITAGALPGQSSSGGADAFFRIYNFSGEEILTQQFGSSGNDMAVGLAVDRAGNIYVAGRTDGALPGQTNAGGTDAFFRKYGR